tara:strand:+ start:50 stop:637 length:588 start_codon:yes stop_codon:yes gene_type:complete
VQNYLIIVSFILGAYLLSSVPFALLISKLKKIDLRKVGSGNLGATNVYRALGFQFAILVFILDAAKGLIPTYLAMFYFSNPLWHVAIGLVTIIGHSLSIFVKFKGGKGVATGLGVIMALNPLVAAILAALGFASIAITRYVAPTSIVCAVIAPVLFYFFNSPDEYIIFISVISTLIIFRHKDNITRLIHGKENKV